MLRQNPVQKKRGEMNLKHRLLAPEKCGESRPEPQEVAPEPVVTAPVAPVVAPAPQPKPVSRPAVAVAPSEKPAPVTQTPHSGYESQLDFYQIPTVFSALLVDPRSVRTFQMLQESLDKARASKHDFFIAVFEGALAANQSPADVHQAVQCYRHALDLSGSRREKSDGFLHSLIWHLYAANQDDNEVAELLDRVRTELKSVPAHSDKRDDAVRRVLDTMKQYPGFEASLDVCEQVERLRNELLEKRISRKGCLAGNRSLLLFPRGEAETESGKLDFQTASPFSPHDGYYWSSNGRGIVLNPGPAFFDGLYRLGGSLEEMDDIVLTDVSRVERSTLEQMLFLAKRPGGSPARLYVTNEIEQHYPIELRKLGESKGVDGPIRLDENLSTELSGGETLSLRYGVTTLRNSANHTLQFVRLADTHANFGPDKLETGVSILVFTIDRQDDLYWAASLAKEVKPALAVFHVPETRPAWLQLAEPLRQFLGDDVPLAFASPMLVCDVENRRFLDAVKAYDDHYAHCWTEFDKLASDAEGTCCFEKGMENRFDEERTEILESLRFYLRRRQGLYFTK